MKTTVVSPHVFAGNGEVRVFKNWQKKRYYVLRLQKQQLLHVAVVAEMNTGQPQGSQFSHCSQVKTPLLISTLSAERFGFFSRTPDRKVQVQPLLESLLA